MKDPVIQEPAYYNGKLPRFFSWLGWRKLEGPITGDPITGHLHCITSDYEHFISQKVSPVL